MIYPRWGRIRGIGVGAVALLACLTAAPASGDAAERPWSSTTLPPEVRWGYDAGLELLGGGKAAAVYQGGGVRAAIDPGSGTFANATTLEPLSSYFPVVDSSAAGGAVAAWYQQTHQQLGIAELPPGGTAFGTSSYVPSTAANFSYNRPKVAVGSDGTAAVAYLAVNNQGNQVVKAVVRPAGGSFGPPESAGPARDPDLTHPTSVAVGGDGTVAVGFQLENRAAVAVRTPGGTWSDHFILGETPGALRPQVAVDGNGNVAVAFAQDIDKSSSVGKVMVAFGDANGFDDPIDSGLGVWDTNGTLLIDASVYGELLLVVDAETPITAGSQLNGVWAAYGSTARRELGPPGQLGPTWAEYPKMDMNPRGDAVVVWQYDACCSGNEQLLASRRAPFGTFGDATEIPAPDGIEPEGSPFAKAVAVDEYGNAGALWNTLDGSTSSQLFVATDSPAITDAPPEPEPTETLPPVVEPAPTTPVDPEPPTEPGPQDPTPQPGPVQYPQPWPAGPEPHAEVALKGTAPRGTVLVRASCTVACSMILRGSAGEAGNLRRIVRTLTPGKRRILRMRFDKPLTARKLDHLDVTVWGHAENPLGSLGGLRDKRTIRQP